MEIKKSPEADLESYRTAWLMVGYIVALVVLLVAFEWTERDESPDMDFLLSDLVFEEELDVPVVEHPVVTPPAAVPPPVAPPVVKEKIAVVENDEPADEIAEVSSEQSVGGMSEDLPSETAVPVQPSGDEAYVVVDELPEFVGGLSGLMRYLTQHIRYPQAAWEHQIQGNVLCQFIVQADGSITDVKVLQGVHPLLDREAVRVLGTMPRWKPGILRGELVKVRFTLPVVFTLK